jgi:hypothetical protein
VVSEDDAGASCPGSHTELVHGVLVSYWSEAAPHSNTTRTSRSRCDGHTHKWIVVHVYSRYKLQSQRDVVP